MKLPPIPAFLFAALGLLVADNHDDAVERLLKVPQFAFGGVGFAGVTSQGEKDYEELLARPTAEVDFEKVFSAGNIQAKCYALTGLCSINRAKYLELSEGVHGQTLQVSVAHGCIMSQQPVAKVLDQIGAGQYSHKK